MVGASLKRRCTVSASRLQYHHVLSAGPHSQKPLHLPCTQHLHCMRARVSRHSRRLQARSQLGPDGQPYSAALRCKGSHSREVLGVEEENDVLSLVVGQRHLLDLAIHNGCKEREGREDAPAAAMPHSSGMPSTVEELRSQAAGVP